MTTLILVSTAPLSPVSELNADQMSSRLIDWGTASRRTPSEAGGNGGRVVEPADELTRPHVLTIDVADVIVPVHGGKACTGTPITGTTFVVTAAHCVLVGDHAAASRTVLRNDIEYNAVSVLVNPDYHDSPSPRLDAAVLVMDHVIPGPSASLGDAFPAQGAVTLVGFQPLDTDGSLLRGTRYDNRPQPQGSAGGAVKIETAAAGCVHRVAELEITDTRVKVPCGLIPGASGGGLFVHNNDELSLVGIISTVAPDLTYNGVTPLTAVRELLDNPDEYAHEMAGATPPKLEPALSMDAKLRDLANRRLIPRQALEPALSMDASSWNTFSVSGTNSSGRSTATAIQSLETSKPR